MSSILEVLPIGTQVVTTYPSRKNICGWICSKTEENSSSDLNSLNWQFTKCILLSDGSKERHDIDFIVKTEIEKLSKDYYLPRDEQDEKLSLNEFDKKEIEIEIVFLGENCFSRRIFKGLRYHVVREIKEYKLTNNFKFTKLCF